MGICELCGKEIGNVSISYTSAHTAKKFDSTRFKAEHADIYDKYVKERTVKSSIRIKLK